jgi:hypothetical protein
VGGGGVIVVWLEIETWEISKDGAKRRVERGGGVGGERGMVAAVCVWV